MTTYFETINNINNSAPALTHNYIQSIISKNKAEAKDNLVHVKDLETKGVKVNYAIVDHIGSIDSEDISAIYSYAYNLAKKRYGFSEVYTCKQVATITNPYADVDKMKNVVRNTYNPERVFMICPDLTDKVAWWIDTWMSYRKLDRNTKVTIVTYGPNHSFTSFEYEPENIKLEYEDDPSIKRMCAAIWANAIGWTFSAPLYRDATPDDITMFQPIYKRSELDEMTDAEKKHITKISTSAESFHNAKRRVASDAEVDAFWQEYKYLYSAGLLEEWISMDYKLGADNRPEFKQPEVETYYDDNDDFISHVEIDLNIAKLASVQDVDVDHATLSTKQYVKFMTMEKLAELGCFFPELKKHYIG